MFSEHHKDWALSIKKMIHNHEKCMDDYLREKDKCYKIVDNNIHVENLYGVNNHHIIESCYKGLAIAIKKAITISKNNTGLIPSTKGKIINDGE